MDIVELHGRCVAEFLRRTRGVAPALWQEPTPCAGWTVRDLVNHMVYEERWTPPMMAGATIESVGDRFDGDLLGDDPAEAVEDASREAQAAMVEPARAGRIVHLSFGDRPADEYAYQLAADHLIHSWDLAVATGQDPWLPDDVVQVVADWFAMREQEYREFGAIGPRPDRVSDGDSDPQARLLVAFGRDPEWSHRPSEA